MVAAYMPLELCGSPLYNILLFFKTVQVFYIVKVHALKKEGTVSAWKSSPVWSFIHIWQDQDQDQSPAVERMQETRLNQHEPVQSGLIQLMDQSGPVFVNIMDI